MAAFLKKHPVLPLLILWSLIFFTLADKELIYEIHNIVIAAVVLVVTIRTFSHFLKSPNNNIILYGALGLSCLTIGNLYFILLGFVNRAPDFISVGNFSLDCCYLFFLAVLMALKGKRLYFKAVNILAVVITVLCAYAVIVNNDIIMNINALTLDLLCIVFSISLLSQKNARFFALIILILTSFDAITAFELPYFIALFMKASVVILYYLLAQSLLSIKVGEQGE